MLLERPSSLNLIFHYYNQFKSFFYETKLNDREKYYMNERCTYCSSFFSFCCWFVRVFFFFFFSSSTLQRLPLFLFFLFFSRRSVPLFVAGWFLFFLFTSFNSAVVSIYLITSTTVPQIPILVLRPELGTRFAPSVHDDISLQNWYSLPLFPLTKEGATSTLGFWTIISPLSSSFLCQAIL